MKLWIVRTPTGDRPYVSTHKPQSYIDHLDASGEKAEVFEVELVDHVLQDLLPNGGANGYSSSGGTKIVAVRRER